MPTTHWNNNLDTEIKNLFATSQVILDQCDFGRNRNLRGSPCLLFIYSLAESFQSALFTVAIFGKCDIIHVVYGLFGHILNRLKTFCLKKNDVYKYERDNQI